MLKFKSYGVIVFTSSLKILFHSCGHCKLKYMYMLSCNLGQVFVGGLLCYCCPNHFLLCEDTHNANLYVEENSHLTMFSVYLKGAYVHHVL